MKYSLLSDNQNPSTSHTTPEKIKQWIADIDTAQQANNDKEAKKYIACINNARKKSSTLQHKKIRRMMISMIAYETSLPIIRLAAQLLAAMLPKKAIIGKIITTNPFKISAYKNFYIQLLPSLLRLTTEKKITFCHAHLPTNSDSNPFGIISPYSLAIVEKIIRALPLNILNDAEDSDEEITRDACKILKLIPCNNQSPWHAFYGLIRSEVSFIPRVLFDTSIITNSHVYNKVSLGRRQLRLFCEAYLPNFQDKDFDYSNFEDMSYIILCCLLALITHRHATKGDVTFAAEFSSILLYTTFMQSKIKGYTSPLDRKEHLQNIFKKYLHPVSISNTETYKIKLIISSYFNLLDNKTTDNMIKIDKIKCSAKELQQDYITQEFLRSLLLDLVHRGSEKEKAYAKNTAKRIHPEYTAWQWFTIHTHRFAHSFLPGTQKKRAKKLYDLVWDTTPAAKLPAPNHTVDAHADEHTPKTEVIIDDVITVYTEPNTETIEDAITVIPSEEHDDENIIYGEVLEIQPHTDNIPLDHGNDKNDLAVHDIIDRHAEYIKLHKESSNRPLLSHRQATSDNNNTKHTLPSEQQSFNNKSKVTTNPFSLYRQNQGKKQRKQTTNKNHSHGKSNRGQDDVYENARLQFLELDLPTIPSRNNNVVTNQNLHVIPSLNSV